MKEKVLQTIQDYHLIENGDKLVLGVSGGPDSLAMLSVLDEIRKDTSNALCFDMVVAHINHKIREEADEDEEFVRNFCEKRGVSFYGISIDVLDLAHTKKIGEEEAGREVRYEFFEKVLVQTNANKIAIAHHKNDKIETILMNILRGSGISGLRGMQPMRDNKFIRPLLACERSEIESYCGKEGLEPRMDKTNLDNSYTRNRIRNVVIPYIQEEFNPNIIQTMDRLSNLVIEEDNYLKEETEKYYRELLIEERQKEIVLDLSQFNYCKKVIKARVVLYTVERLMGTTKGIEKIHIEDILRLCGNNIGNKYLTPNKNLKILIQKGQIYLIKQR